MRVLITGGCGFIGSHLAEALHQMGHEVTVLDDLSGGKVANLANSPEIRLIHEDLAICANLEELLDKTDCVFHLAAKADIVPSIEQPQAYFDANVLATQKLLISCVNKGVRKFIYAASSSCYGLPVAIPTTEEAPVSPQYPYALSKLMAEQLVLHWSQVYGLDVTSLRLFNVYGPRARTSGSYGAVMGVFLAQKFAGRPLTIVGDGEQRRDFVHVEDVVDAFILAMQAEGVGDVFNVGGGNPRSVNELAAIIGGERVTIPWRPGEPEITFADISKIRRKLGWKPSKTLEQGVSGLLDDPMSWKDAPVWDQEGIAQATEKWFRYLGAK